MSLSQEKPRMLARAHIPSKCKDYDAEDVTMKMHTSNIKFSLVLKVDISTLLDAQTLTIKNIPLRLMLLFSPSNYPCVAGFHARLQQETCTPLYPEPLEDQPA